MYLTVSKIQGGSYVGVWNVAGNPAGVVPVTKENSADQAEFIVMMRTRMMWRMSDVEDEEDVEDEDEENVEEMG